MVTGNTEIQRESEFVKRAVLASDFGPYVTSRTDASRGLSLLLLTAFSSFEPFVSHSLSLILSLSHLMLLSHARNFVKDNGK